ncbi:MAG: hypothetical protein WC523_03560 [Patescibacteria group bacterium]
MRNYLVRIKFGLKRGAALVVFFGVGLVLLTAFVFGAKTGLAATSTVRGLAWWGDTYRYVYFNCLDDIVGDRLDVSENLYSLPEPRGFHFYSEPCTDLIHGVYISLDNKLSGEAWNQTMDLISFNATTSPPAPGYDFNVHCPTCTLANGCMACYNETDQKVYGWARVVKDGSWIRLDSSIPSTPAVKIQSWDTADNPVLPGTDIPPGDFIGTASSPLSNLSFNCETEINGTSNCAMRNYKVYISNLQIGHLSAPNWTYTQACSGPARTAVLKWYKKSGQQTAYEIVVNNSETLSTSTAVCWSGKKTSAVAGQYILPNSDPTCGELAYNTNYYWWIRLYDENDNPTEWYQYTTNSGTDTDGNSDGNSKTFTTYRHEFPSPYFTWDPYEPEVASSTLFTSNSFYYTDGSPSTPQSCFGPNCLYLWTTTDAGAIISRATNSTTSIIFKKATGTTVTLRLTDINNYVCSTSSLIMINYGLPIWHEIKAE